MFVNAISDKDEQTNVQVDSLRWEKCRVKFSSYFSDIESPPARLYKRNLEPTLYTQRRIRLTVQLIETVIIVDRVIWQIPALGASI